MKVALNRFEALIFSAIVYFVVAPYSNLCLKCLLSAPDFLISSFPKVQSALIDQLSSQKLASIYMSNITVSKLLTAVKIEPQ